MPFARREMIISQSWSSGSSWRNVKLVSSTAMPLDFAFKSSRSNRACNSASVVGFRSSAIASSSPCQGLIATVTGSIWTCYHLLEVTSRPHDGPTNRCLVGETSTVKRNVGEERRRWRVPNRTSFDRRGIQSGSSTRHGEDRRTGGGRFQTRPSIGGGSVA